MTRGHGGSPAIMIAIGKARKQEQPERLSAYERAEESEMEHEAAESPAFEAAEEEGEGESSKSTPESAAVIRATEHCGMCAHWQPDQSCEKVDGKFEAEDACYAYFEPKGGEQLPAVPAPVGAPEAMAI